MAKKKRKETIHMLAVGPQTGQVYRARKLLLVSRVLCRTFWRNGVLATWDKRRINCKSCLKRLNKA